MKNRNTITKEQFLAKHGEDHVIFEYIAEGRAVFADDLSQKETDFPLSEQSVENQSYETTKRARLEQGSELGKVSRL